MQPTAPSPLTLAQDTYATLASCAEAGDESGVERAGAALLEIAALHPSDEDMQHVLARGAFKAHRLYCHTPHRPGRPLKAPYVHLEDAFRNFDPDLERWGFVLAELVAVHPAHAGIAFELAKSAVNAVISYSHDKGWESVERWAATLQRTATAHPASADIQLAMARGALNALMSYGQAQDLPNMERWGTVLRQTATAHPEDQDMQFTLVKGSYHASKACLHNHDRPAAERWIALFQDLAGTRPGDEEMQRRLGEVASMANSCPPSP